MPKNIPKGLTFAQSALPTDIEKIFLLSTGFVESCIVNQQMRLYSLCNHHINFFIPAQCHSRNIRRVKAQDLSFQPKSNGCNI